MKFGIGQSVKRKEDARFLTGRGRFVGDLITDDVLSVQFVRSPVSHAKIIAINTDEASAVPGVKAILTGAEYQADGLGGLSCSTIFPLHQDVQAAPVPAFAIDTLRYIGQPVAMVVADTRAAAITAAEMVDVDYEDMQVVTTPAQALASDAPQIWPHAPGNLAFRIDLGDAAATDVAIACAAHVTRLKIYNNRLSANTLEPRSSLAQYDSRDDRVTLHTSTQAPHTVRSAVASATGLAQSKLRVVAQDVGGGFGMKGGAYLEDILITWAAHRMQSKLGWCATRSESLLSDYHGRDQWVEGELALDKDGRITALRARFDYNTGAYLAPGGGVSPMFAATLATGCYQVPVAHVHAQAVLTNTAPTHPYRGAGRPEAAYLIERLMDKAAAETGRDRIEIRRLNMLQPDDFPYKTPLVYVMDSGDYPAVVDRALAIANWDSAPERKAAAKAKGKLCGIGIALHTENAGLANDSVEIRFDPDGSVSVVAGTFSHGQGHETVYAQMVSDWLGVPFEAVRLVQGDSDAVAFGRGTVASRSMINGGSSLHIAAEQVIAKAKAIAAHLMDVTPEQIDFDQGELSVQGTNRKMTLPEVAGMSFRPILPPELGIGLSGKGEFLLQGFTFPNGCQIVEVEIDPDTGETEIRNYVSIDDVGTVINPMLLDGQMIGGIAQGLGQALMEDVVYDEDGQLLTGSFMDYAMPRASDMPDVQIEMMNTPTKTNPLGVKGAGEAGTVGATPAIVSAILDALAPLGVTDIALPATPHRIWQAIQTADD